MACLLAGCLRPAEDRARLDTEVGAATLRAGLQVRVEDGLASVRDAEAGVIELWAQAPRLQIRLEPAQPAGEQTLRVLNCMPQARLRAVEGGSDVTIEGVSQPRPTHKEWSLRLTGEGPIELELAPPDAAREETWRFALLSDVQEAIDEVQDLFTAINARDDIRLVVSTGDLTERGTRAELTRFQRELEQLDVPFFSTRGNHELGNNDPSVWTSLYGRANFHFVFKGTAFTLVDSGNATLDPLVYGWLGEWLRQSREQPHVFVTHVPLIDPVGVRNGSFGSRKEAGMLLAKLAEQDVDLTLYGHVHTYLAFSNAAIPAYISGGGGAIPERGDGIDRHFLIVTVDPPRGIDRVAVVRVD